MHTIRIKRPDGSTRDVYYYTSAQEARDEAKRQRQLMKEHGADKMGYKLVLRIVR